MLVLHYSFKTSDPTLTANSHYDGEIHTVFSQINYLFDKAYYRLANRHPGVELLSMDIGDCYGIEDPEYVHWSHRKSLVSDLDVVDWAGLKELNKWLKFERRGHF